MHNSSAQVQQLTLTDFEKSKQFHSWTADHVQNSDTFPLHGQTVCALWLKSLSFNYAVCTNALKKATNSSGLWEAIFYSVPLIHFGPFNTSFGLDLRTFWFNTTKITGVKKRWSGSNWTVVRYISSVKTFFGWFGLFDHHWKFSRRWWRRDMYSSLVCSHMWNQN